MLLLPFNGSSGGIFLFKCLLLVLSPVTPCDLPGKDGV